MYFHPDLYSCYIGIPCQFSELYVANRNEFVTYDFFARDLVVRT